MIKTNTVNIEEYLEKIPDERRSAIKKIRQVILKNLPKGYEEGMQYGMISYFVPLDRLPDGYLGDKRTPLPYVSLASQKNHMSIYINSIYADSELNNWFIKEYGKTGNRLDMGKSCVRFKKLDDLPVDLIGKVVSKVSVDEYVEMYERARKK